MDVDARKREVIIAANWKMHKTRAEVQAFCHRFLPLLDAKDVEVVICPPAVLIDTLVENLGHTPVAAGIQNIHWEKEGAYTGEISAAMAADAGCRYCLCGHSERRHYFEETSEMITRKAAAALANGLRPIVCVGETLAERENGYTMEVLRSQLLGSLLGVANGGAQVVVAYEPVWAIGTGIVASPADAESAIAYIRSVLVEMWGAAVASTVSILYGGSVKPQNIQELMACPNIDGVLVGGASLDAESFAALANYRAKA